MKSESERGDGAQLNGVKINRNSVVRYNNYCKIVESPHTIQMDKPHELLLIAAKFIKSKVLTKRHRRLRDQSGRCLAHYLALLYGLEGLHHIQDPELGFLHALDRDHMTPLHYAACFAEQCDVEKLVKLKCDLTAKNRFGHTAQIVAIAVGNQYFDQQCDQIEFQFTPEVLRLHMRVAKHSVQHNDVQIVTHLIQQNNAHPLLLNFRDKHYATLLHIACYHGLNGMVQFLIEAGVNPNALDAYGNTPLHIAVQCVDNVSVLDGGSSEYGKFIYQNRLIIVESLLQAQVDRECQNHKGQQAYEMAVEKSPAWNLIRWKYWRYRQKYDDDYLFESDVLNGSYWEKTLALLPADKMQQNLKAFNGNGHRFRMLYVSNTVTAMHNELVALFPTFSIVRLFKNDFGALRDDLCKTCLALPKSKSEGYKKDPYRKILSGIIKGDSGAFKKAKLVILQKHLKPHGLMLQFLGHIEEMLLRQIAAEDQINKKSSYFKISKE